MRTVAILALPDVIPFDLATPLEVFGRARLLDDRPAYRVLVCGSEPLVSAGAIRIGVEHGLDALEHADTVVVPGRHHPDLPAPPEALGALRRAAQDGARIASICVGAFVLAEAGLLDGMRATTHWRATDLLAARYPAVDVDPEVLYVDNGQILTSAGAAAGLDLCLHLVHTDHGAAVAADAARLAVTPLHREGGQAQFILRNPPAGSSASIRLVQEWIEQNSHRNLTLADIAEATHMSVRTLNRRFHAEVGHSPMQWVNGVRVRHAQELLETTDLDVARIARHVGFSNPANFRALFKTVAGVNASSYRTAFRGRQIPTGRVLAERIELPGHR